MRLDLHIHTTASDGQYPADAIIRMAEQRKLVQIAVTDHDTTDGIEAARAVAELAEVRVIPGIEISTQLEEEIHILGYGIDERESRLCAACAEYMESRRGRGTRIAAYLESRGVSVDMEEIKAIAGDGSLGRPHFAEYLQAHGYVRTRQEAFSRYLTTAEFHKQTDRIKPTPQEAVALIHGAGGKAVLAHPGLLKIGKARQEELIQTLVAAGLDGIEAYYPKHTFPQTKYYRNMAVALGIRISGGSDFHGEKVKPGVEMGMTVPDEFKDLLITEALDMK